MVEALCSRRLLLLLSAIAAVTTVRADAGITGGACSCPRPDAGTCFGSSDCGPGGVCFPYPEWPICEPAGCHCENGTWICATICAGRCFPETFDSDCDGYADWRDCGTSNPEAWETPSEVRGLRFTSQAMLGWFPPFYPGGTVTSYDTLRSEEAADFIVPVVCVESDDGSDREANDPTIPGAGQSWFYLVRAQNLCPGSSGLGPLGRRSDGTVIAGRDCP